jgi:hypothetical protein
MSFIALDICGGRFTKYCSIPGMALHTLSVDASYLPFPTIQRSSDGFQWVPSRNDIRMRM